MTLPPSPAEPTSRPERDGAGVPEGIGRLLHLLHWLIGYGRILADNLHRLSPQEFGGFAKRYRRTDFAEILARIKRGIMLAAALEEKLRKRASTGRDIAPVDARYPAPGAGNGAGGRKRVRHTNLVDMPPDRLPTAAQIAAELRRRPLGAVLADICRDLGVQPDDLTSEQWSELRRLIIRYGGDFMKLIFTERALRLQTLCDAERRKRTAAPAHGGAPGNKSARPTGPPPLPQAA